MPFPLLSHSEQLPLFSVSPWREQCMNEQVTRCVSTMPTGAIPTQPTPTPSSASCCSVYMKGGYSKPFPPYVTQQMMKNDNRFFQRQDFPTQSFLPSFPEDLSYSPMTFLYPSLSSCNNKHD